MEKELSFDTFRITNDFLCKTNPKMFYTNCEQKHLWNWFFMTFSFQTLRNLSFDQIKKFVFCSKLFLSFSLFLFPSKREKQYHTKVDFGIPLIFNTFCIPENYNTNISHQLFDYTLTFLNSKHRTQIQKVILYSKTGFIRSV